MASRPATLALGRLPMAGLLGAGLLLLPAPLRHAHAHAQTESPAPLVAGQTPAIATPQQLRAAQARAAVEREAAQAAGQQALALAQEERRLAERRVAVAQRVQQAERRLAEAEAEARTAAAAADHVRQLVGQRAASLAPLLPVMRRLTLWPAESLLAAPVPAEDAVRGLQALHILSRRLAEDVAALRQAERNAERQGAAAAEQARRLAGAQGVAQQLSQQMEVEMAAARQLRAGANQAETEAARRAQDAASRAATLEAALAQLERERAQAARRGSLEAAREAAPPGPPRGGRVMPVAGQVSREFGAAGEAGPARGATWLAAPGARVVSPCGGRVVFAGPFRSYGNLLIVDCGDATHFVLAGLDRLDVPAGQRLLAGEPVGVLAPATEGRSRATLYMELRQAGQPVDPQPWLAARG